MKTQGIKSTWRKTIAGLLLASCAAGSLEAAAPTINIQMQETNAVVNFSGRLQSASRVEGPYLNVDGAVSPHQTSTSPSTAQFWRSVLSDVRSIAAGGGQTLAVRNDGTLWAWGLNQHGQVGIGTTNDVEEPVQVGIDANWRTVSEGAGANHSLAIRDDGTLWAWGDNRFGQLGLGHTNEVYEPLQVGTNAHWESVAAGLQHTVAIMTDGTLWAWGKNRFGQLGNGTTNRTFAPMQIGTDANWQAVSVSTGDPQRTDPYYTDQRFSHTTALRNDGTLWAWGNNQAGQLGIGTQADTPPYGVTEPTQVGTDSDWRAVSAGGFHNLALRTNGTLWGWGVNDYGQLAIGQEILGNQGGTNGPVQIGTNADWLVVYAGGKHSMGIRLDHTLWAWGSDQGGQLGIETSDNKNGTRYPTATGSAPWQVGSHADWQAVAAGQSHTVALRDDGSIWTWGDGGLGRNVVGSAQDVRVGSETNWLTVDAGNDFTVAMRADGTLWSWGWGGRGLLGLGTSGDVNEPTQIGTNDNWKSVDAGNIGVAAIRTDGTLWTWGGGQLSPTQIGTNTNWRAASVSGQAVVITFDQRHFAALRDDGTIWTWGTDGQGQLGLGDIDTNQVREPRQVGTNTNWRHVSAGWMHTMAIRDDGTLWGWGLNGPGALGIGTFDIEKTNQPVQVGTDTNWATVSALRLYTRALRTDGTLWAWGLNINGQLGITSTTNVNAPVQVGTATDWRHVSTDDNHFYQEGANPEWPWRSTGSGWRHSVYILHDGSMWASGANDLGQIAQPVSWRPYPVIGSNWGWPKDQRVGS